MNATEVCPFCEGLGAIPDNRLPMVDAAQTCSRLSYTLAEVALLLLQHLVPVPGPAMMHELESLMGGLDALIDQASQPGDDQGTS